MNAGKSNDRGVAPGEALSGLVVLEVSSSPGASFTAALLADFNASVYLCESPPRGSHMRSREPEEWWPITARNKQSIAIDANAPGASLVVRRILEATDVVVTDVPAVERQNNPWLRELDNVGEKPLLVDVVAPGADKPDLWPWSKRADMAAAVTGMMALTGHPNGEPVQPEFPLAEYLSGALAALRAVAEIRRRKLRGGSAVDVEVPLHLAAFRMIEWQVPIATTFGRPELRNGNAFPMNFSISNMLLTKDGKYVTVSAANDAQAKKLLEMVGGEALRDDPRFATLEARMKGLSALYEIMDRWTAQLTLTEVLDVATRHGIVMGPIADAASICTHEQVAARKNIVEMRGNVGAMLAMPGVIPRVEGWNTAVRSIGPALGAQTADMLRRCGMTDTAISELKLAKIIWA